MTDLVIQGMGFAGAFLLLFAYWRLSSGVYAAHSRRYQLLNLAGSLLVAATTAWQGAYGPFLLNVAWSGIALAGVWRWRRGEQTSRRKPEAPGVPPV